MIEAPIVEAIKRDNWIKRRDYSLINDCDQYFQSHPGELTRIVTPKYSEVGAAFRGHGKVILTCVDEGIRDDIDLSSLGVEGPFRLLHIAGSGITQPEIVERNCFAYSSIYGVTAHEDCGAVAAIAAQTGEDQTKIAEDFAKLQAEKLQTKYLGLIKTSEMSRPEGIHIAYGCYVDGTGVLEQGKSEYLPDHCFTITAPFFRNNLEKVAEEIQLSVSIRQGNAGYGLREDKEYGFSDENPFYIFVTGSNNDYNLRLNKLMEVVESVAKSMPAVKIVGLEQP